MPVSLFATSLAANNNYTLRFGFIQRAAARKTMYPIVCVFSAAAAQVSRAREDRPKCMKSLCE